MAENTAPEPERAPRLLSLDALRGFDMFWIIGGDALVAALHKVSDARPVRLLAEQLDHKEWEGFAFYDLIFPLFVFIVGVSIVLSLAKLEKTPGTDRGRLVRKVLMRGLLLFVLGLIYSGGLRNGWAGVRIMGVLQRIAICYTATALLFTFLRPRALVGVAVGL